MSKKMEYEEFIKLANEKHNGKYVYDDKTKLMFNGSHSVIGVVCPIHGRYYTLAKNHLKYECEKCSYIKRGLAMRSNTNEFIEKAKKVHGDKYDYSKVEYKTAKKDKVCIICPKHGEFFIKPNDHLNGEGCPKCKESHLERNLSILLESKGVPYIRKKHFEWLRRQEIDFYIDGLNIGIECQGKHHLGLGGWSDSFDLEKQLSLDNLKNRLCSENGVELLYLIDPLYFKAAKNFEIYNCNNTFYDINVLIEYVKEKNRIMI